jgi:glucosamine--fructose-6-phosphate aminotransferase (isomerizing)
MSLSIVPGTRQTCALSTDCEVDVNPTHRTETATYSEILTQTAAWQEALETVTQQADELLGQWSEKDYVNVIFTGCGSTYYLSLAAAALLQKLTGRLAKGVPGGELMMYPDAAYTSEGPTLLIALSRSGETTETLLAVKGFSEQQRGDVITVTNCGDRPLADMGMVNFVIPSGRERSVAQTRSFASMYVATTAMAATLTGRQDLLQSMQYLPEHGQRLIVAYEDLARSLGSDLALDRFYFLGSGPRYGLACETNLKMKEMSLTHSEPFHFLEFRHGPKSMVGPSTMVIGLLSQVNRPSEAAVLEDAKSLGARILSIGESATDITFASQLPELTRNVLYLPVLQLMAYYRALAKNLDPDRPHNLEAVVKLEAKNWVGDD